MQDHLQKNSFKKCKFCKEVKMIKFVVLLTVVALSQAAKSRLPIAKPESRIVNGFEAKPRQFPYQTVVMITNQGQAPYPCGGSLLSNSWVLSASHCLYQAVSVQCLFGSIYKNRMPIVRDVSEIVRPSTFNLSTLRDDITLLKLRLVVRFTRNVQPIMLPSRSDSDKTYSGSILTVSGFGKTTTAEDSPVLLYTEVIGITNDECEELYGELVTMKILCTHGYPNVTQGSCTGDSGGPLMYQDNGTQILAAMVSFVSGRGCDYGDPQGFTRIGSYLDFISNTTNIPLRN